MESTWSDDIQEALLALPETFRTVVQLVDIESRSYKEVAESMGTPIGTVMSRLFRARRELREQLAHLGMERGIIEQDPKISSA